MKEVYELWSFCIHSLRLTVPASADPADLVDLVDLAALAVLVDLADPVALVVLVALVVPAVLRGHRLAVLLLRWKSPR